MAGARRALRWMGYPLLALAAACNPSSGGYGYYTPDDAGEEGAPDLAIGRDGAQAPRDLAMARPDLAVGYPAGPYGNLVGDVLADFAMSGYRLSPQQDDSSLLPWDTNIRLADFHASKACECLLITWGAGWCTACKQEQPRLVFDVNNDPAFCVLGILQEGNAQGPAATRADVDAWTQRYRNNFYVVQGTTKTKQLWQGHARNGVISLPFNFIVRTSTMEIVGVVQGYRQDIHNYSMNLCR